MYINEIIRITYKCNWSCKFCNVLKVNNFGEQDILEKEVIFKILSLVNKYNKNERKKLILSFSGGETLLDKNICKYIKLAKKIGIGQVQIQTNGSLLFKNQKLLQDLIESGLDEIFLASHSHLDEVNKILGCFYKFEDFKNFVKYLLENNVKINIRLNIVITKINLNSTLDFIKILKEIGFLDYIGNEISFGFVQPNGYAYKNKNEVLLKFDDLEKNIINKIINFCKSKNIKLDFHYTSPPLCILNNPEYNLEFKRLKKLELDKKNNKISQSNLESLKFLHKEKIKLNKCKNCTFGNYCSGFYKNWVDFVGIPYLNKQIDNFLNKNYEL